MLFKGRDGSEKQISTKKIKHVSDPIGGIKYSIKALRRESSSSAYERLFTNSNGMTMYRECASDTCNKQPVSCHSNKVYGML